MSKPIQYVIDFYLLGLKDINQVGGKNASLGEMIKNLTALGVTIPQGFATTADAYREFLADNNLNTIISQELTNLNSNSLKKLTAASTKIRKLILAAKFNHRFIDSVTHHYTALVKKYPGSFAVRSSATAEDLPQASFAGQHDSFLNIHGVNNILTAIKKTYASLFHKRAISYRIQNNFSHEKVALSAGVQVMVRSDKATSGVMFTLDTETGFDQVVFINASWGLGEAIVQGQVNPDEFYVYKPGVLSNRNAILQRNLGGKAIKIVYGKNQRATKCIKTTSREQQHFCLDDKIITQLARLAITIEKHYKKPMDIEWALDGISKKLFIVQARPETVRSQDQYTSITRYTLTKTSETLVQGHSVGQKIGQGKACVITSVKNMNQMRPGQVLVTDMTDPDWEPIMKMAQAIVTNRGGRTCHAAIVARELGIPAVVGCNNATTKIKNQQPITASCASGEVGCVYKGILPIKVDTLHLTNLPRLPAKLKLCLNLGDPHKAFSYQYLPNDGVGLARLEFIINSMIGIHPKALLQLAALPKKLKQQIIKHIKGYKNPTEFYIEKLREGIATIAAAFFPKPVIVRFSDFKSNEYANLLGGKIFEPHEENPMIGFRGGSRYLAPQFADCFALECEAIKRVQAMGLTNTQVMLPFVRTVDEAKQLIALLKKNGLKRGENKLKIIQMCEIPSNVLLARDFLKLCDGFSIGSNDLTQLTLGLDRDSSLVSHLFDERNPAIKQLLHEVIKICKKKKKYIGICGQAPSDYPEFAKWLVHEGIDAISLTSDAIVKTWLYLGTRD